MPDKPDHDPYRVLLESTLAIPWRIDWRTKEFTYIGPQIEALLGWKQGSWKTAQDWIDRIHADDREGTVSYCVGLSEEGVDHEADYRALNSDGGSVWIRDVVHVLRENGATVALVGFMFDITERKRMELQLEELNRTNQELLRTDTLTGIANRKAFDERIEMEFLRATRNHSPLSLLFIDIDSFKQYNDRYGHLQGDSCLISVSQSLERLFSRPGDLVARYGGEEFVVTLPDTPRHDAVKLAEHCRQEIEALGIPHESALASDVVTVSIGVSTLDWQNNPKDLAEFLDQADRRLYQAKEAGRNRVVGD